MTASIDADGWIARRNVARARAGASLDVGYLGELSEDARGVIFELNALDLDAAQYLGHAWGKSAAAHRKNGWRSLRGLGAR